MSRTISEVKKEHKRLYRIALTKLPDFLNQRVGNSARERALMDSAALLAESEEFAHYLNDVNALVKDIEELSGNTENFEDYQWLSEAALKWKSVFSSTLEIPKNICLKAPSPDLSLPSLPAGRSFLEDEIHDQIARNAESIARYRIGKLGRLSTVKEMLRDIELAELFLVSEIIEGKINFASRIAPDSYWRLENVWVKDIKLFRAYFLWEHRGDGIYDDEQEIRDYYQVCEHLRDMLVNRQIKAQAVEFETPKAYLEDRYLTDGRIDPSKQQMKTLLNMKAYRIEERIREMGGHADSLRDWVEAETYTRMFYENIIPAVITNDPEHVLSVLRAFQYSKSVRNKYHVINSFEVALAIYFLNANTITNLWRQSESYPAPENCLESRVAIRSWPVGFKVPEACRYALEVREDQLIFNGLMSKDQKQALLEQVREPEYQKAIDELFRSSRLIHRETTL